MKSAVTKDGFSADYYNGRIKVRFQPPALVEIVSAEGRVFAYYAVPVTKNVTRTFAVSWTAYRPLLQWVRPAWLDHLRRNVILEADLGMLQSQIGMPWRDYFLPTSSDTMVRALVRWLDVYGYNDQARQWCPENGGGGELGKDVLLRTQGHTEECGRCRAVVKRIDTAINIAYMLGAICVLLDAFQVNIGPVDQDGWRQVWAVCTVNVLVGTRWKKKFFEVLCVIIIHVCNNADGDVHVESTSMSKSCLFSGYPLFYSQK